MTRGTNNIQMRHPSSVLLLLLLPVVIGVLLQNSHVVHASSSPGGGVSPRSGSVCRSPWLLLGSKCILIELSISESWEKGRNFCRGLHKGADLVTFEDANEFAEVLRHTRAINAPQKSISFWVGGTDKNVEHEWRWVTGFLMPVGAPFWSVNEPDKRLPGERCVLMYHETGYYLHDVPCGGWKGLHSTPICEYNPFLHPGSR